MKIRSIEIERCQLGWRCSFFIMVTVADQFSDAEMLAVAGGKHWLTALWNGWRNARRVERIHTATKQQRADKGWV